MTMFDVDTVNVEKKLQEIEDNDLYNFMKKQGYSEEQIKSAIRNAIANTVKAIAASCFAFILLPPNP